jgi:hypothetical protein
MLGQAGNTTEVEGSVQLTSSHQGSLFCKEGKWYFQHKKQLIKTR